LIQKPLASVHMLPSAVHGMTYGTTAMLKPSMFSLALIAALCSCSKSDDAATNETAAAPENALQSPIDPARNDTSDSPQVPASEPEQNAEKAATQTAPEGDEKKRPNAAYEGAKRTRSLTERRWDTFQAAMQRCVTADLNAREQCLADARDAYRSADLNCAALPGRDRNECLKYAKLWEDTEADIPTAAVTHDEEPAAIPSAPDDARPAERNRDSTKQQQDAVGSLPEPTRPDR
jgi:hypothetical protein